MKKVFWWTLYLPMCALVGLLVGYGIVQLLGTEPDTKDNTLTGIEDSVFFSAKEEESEPFVPTLAAPTGTEPPREIPVPTVETPIPENDGAEKQEPVLAQAITVVPTPVLNPTPVPVQPDVSEQPKENPVMPVPTEVVEETITYPAEIFGQTPVVNRDDTVVTYFEFALDLIEAAKAEAKRKGLGETAMFTKFMVKALFCGVEVQSLHINHPISKKEAALAIWIAADVLGEEGTGTKASAVSRYATDAGGCSKAEKKSIVYLYESGVIKGQSFRPDARLSTAESRSWFMSLKEKWK